MTSCCCVEAPAVGWRRRECGLQGMLKRDCLLKRVTNLHANKVQSITLRRGSHRLQILAAKKVERGRSLVMSCTLEAAEGKEEDVIELCKGILDWAGELKSSNKSSGILQFECKHDLFEKNVYHFWERYESFLHLTETRGAPEYIKFLTDVRPLLKKPVGMIAYDYKDGQIGHGRVLIGPKGEGGLDDATGQGKQTSRLIAPGDAYDEGREDWGLKEALELKKKQKNKQREIMEKEKQDFLARTQKKVEDEPLSSEEAERQKRMLKEILSRFEAEKAAKEAAGGSENEKKAPAQGGGWDGLKSIFGLKK